jgi:hypothetical protein
LWLAPGRPPHRLPHRRYAVVVDEAHSSQTGESVKDLKLVLGDAATGGDPERALAAAEASDGDQHCRKGAEMHMGPVWLRAITRYRRAGEWSARPVSAYRPGRCRRRR